MNIGHIYFALAQVFFLLFGIAVYSDNEVLSSFAMTGLWLCVPLQLFFYFVKPLEI